MAPPAEPIRSEGEPSAPSADPAVVRACLTPALAAEFDREWELVLDRARASKDLADVRALLAKWRHIAHGELRDPGSYHRLLAKAEQIRRSGANPGAGSLEDVKALIRERRGD